MEFNVDTKKIKKLVLEKDNNTTIVYEFKDGFITATTLLRDSVSMTNEHQTKQLSDSEMIDRVKKSEFMNELSRAKKKYKLSKEIDDSFPEKDDSGNIKDPAKKTSDESIGIIKEIIKKDIDGTLDEIARHNLYRIDGNIKNALEFSDKDGNEYDVSKCQANLRTIEDKIISIIRKNKGQINGDNNKELNEVLDDYKLYCEKRDKLSDDIWNTKKEYGWEKVKKNQ